MDRGGLAVMRWNYDHLGREFETHRDHLRQSINQSINQSIFKVA